MTKIFKLLVIFLCSINVYAALGLSIESIEADKASLSAVEKATTVKPKYSVKEIKTGGTNIREYISLDGVVFGIAWDGITHPDLNILLGNYASEYKDGFKKNPPKAGIKSHNTLKTNNIVVKKWGHMRNLHGKAYIPSLIPEGVTPDEIK